VAAIIKEGKKAYAVRKAPFQDMAQSRETIITVRGGLRLAARVWGDENADAPSEVIFSFPARLHPGTHHSIGDLPRLARAECAWLL